MKLHLPVRLFRAVMALMLTAPATLYAEYTVPTSITIPNGYTQVAVDELTDITAYSSSSTDVAFRIDGSYLVNGQLTINGQSSSLMSSSADSRYFTSASASSLASLTLSNATTRLFYVLYDESLQFIALKDVLFEGNEYSCKSYCEGGVIYGSSGATIALSENESVTFNGNSAYSSSSNYAYGGAIYGYNITLNNNNIVTFDGNYLTSESYAYGGAIYGNNITLNNNGVVTFNGNFIKSNNTGRGGAIYGSSIVMNYNKSMTFTGNTASGSSAYGGAIYGTDITLNDNENMTFSGNTTSGTQSYGGAIYAYNITLNNNECVTFSENTTSGVSWANGGAIYGNNAITVNNNNRVEFSGNALLANKTSGASYAYGGAIYGEMIEIRGNGSVDFNGNSATSRSESLTSSYYYYSYARGGAIYGHNNSSIELRENGSLSFSGNRVNASSYAGSILQKGEVKSQGGAIYGGTNSTITLTGNKSVGFSENTASYGSAIYGDNNSTITLSGNEEVIFSKNVSLSNFGAIYGGTNSTITLSRNEEVTFSENSGHSIYASSKSTIALNDNGSVAFTGKADSANYAIYTQGNLSIRNNDSVLFEKHVDNDGFLRSISVTGGNGEIYLSAAEGKDIEFRDSIYIESGALLRFNADYTDAEGEIHKQTGDIIFTGKYTEAHLREAWTATGKEGVVKATDILNSRTSEVYTMTYLHGGRLRVEDGAIYKGYGITAMEDSAATVLVKNAELHHKDCELTFHAGTVLELAGNNTISGNVQMMEGSTILLNIGETVGCTDILGNIDINGSITLSDSGAKTIENRVLIYVFGNLNGATQGTFTGNSSATWVDNLLVLNYNKATFNPYFNGSVKYTTSQNTKTAWHHYQTVEFEDCCTDNVGSALQVGEGALTILSNNGNVIFNHNTTSLYGSAMYGESGSQLRLNDNDSVIVSENSATSGYAVYIRGNLSVCNNDSVLFEKNAIISSDTCHLRSIWVNGSESTISLSAAAGGSIEFRDTVYVDTNTPLNLNADYDGKKQTGDIIFTGKYTEEHLNELLTDAGMERKATDDEIIRSRKSEVYTMTNLYGGRLRVEDGAIYIGYGITAMEKSGATVLVKNAELNHQGYELTFHGGTMLELAGDNIICGDVQMKENSTLLLNAGGTAGYTDIIGDINIDGKVTLHNNGIKPIENGILMYVAGELNGWTVDTFTGNTGNTVTWLNNLLILNYNKSTFNPYFNGLACYSTPQRTTVWHHYQSVSFENCIADYDSAVIYGGVNSIISLCSNYSVTFRGDVASSVGVIYGEMDCPIKLSDNTSVTFSGNFGAYNGGVIIAYDNLSIRNNDSVLFEKNLEQTNDGCILRSIYAEGSGNTISLSAASGGSIEFRDSVSITSDTPVYLNADYNGLRQTGDIIFTGKYAEEDLNEMLLKYELADKATVEEVFNSRTSVISAMTHLYGGRLRVEDGAIYTGHGITAMEKSGATVLVKDAELNHRGYELTFHAGTALELAGSNTISGNVQMQKNSSLQLHVNQTAGYTNIIGNLDIAGGLSLLNADTNLTENGILLYVAGERSGRSVYSFTENPDITATWVGNLLVLNYNETTFNRYFNGSSSYNTPQQDKTIWHHYQSLDFVQCDTTAVKASSILLSENGVVRLSGNVETPSSPQACGGAISGMPYGYIGINNNENVEVAENTVHAYSANFDNSQGGAIYIDSFGLVELHGNGGIIFRQNVAEATYRYCNAEGGAIYAGDDSSLSIQYNGNIIFTQNMINAVKGRAFGGAIAGANIVLSHNTGEIKFYGNQAISHDARDVYSSSNGAAIYGTTIVINDNDSVDFSKNIATATSEDTFMDSNARGGAIWAKTLTMSGNESVRFSENTAEALGYGYIIQGGAINSTEINLIGNESVEFIRNSAKAEGHHCYITNVMGGAIWASRINILENDDVVFSGNTVALSTKDSGFTQSAAGGGIYGLGSLNICNNQSVLFERNAEIVDGQYYLKGIHLTTESGKVSLSAAENGTIEFRDNVYINIRSAMSLNADYTDAAGVTHKQTGDIIFTGKYTEEHLNDLLAGDGLSRSATGEEIVKSCTSDIYTMTNLYGGRLRVEDGAIYSGCGITVMEDSAATVIVKDATMHHGGYNLTFNAGTTLSLSGDCLVRGNLVMLQGSMLDISMQYGKEALFFDSLSVEGNVQLSVLRDEVPSTNGVGELMLLYTNSSDINWNPTSFNISLYGNLADGYLYQPSESYWKDNALYLKYAITDTVTWTNASGDGCWNNSSTNWNYDGCTIAKIEGVRYAVLGSEGQGRIEFDCNIEVGTLIVNEACSYELNFAKNASLKLNGGLITEAESELILHGDLSASSVTALGTLEVDGQLSIDGVLNGAVVRTGSLTANEVKASTLTLTDKDGTNVIVGDVAVAENINMAGSLASEGHLTCKTISAGGLLNVASLAVSTLNVGALQLTDADAHNTVNGAATVNGGVDVVGSLTVGGHLKGSMVSVGGALKASSLGTTDLKATSLFLTNASANSTVDGAITIGGAVDVVGSLTTSGQLTGTVINVGHKLVATSLNATGLLATDLVLTGVGLNNTVNGEVEVSGSVDIEGSLGAEKLRLSAINTTHTIDGNVKIDGEVDIAGNLSTGGALSATAVNIGGSLAAASLSADSVFTDLLTLTAVGAISTVRGEVRIDNAIKSAGSLLAEGVVSADSVQIAGELGGTTLTINNVLQAGYLTADSVSANVLTLSTVGANSTVSGNVRITETITSAGNLLAHGGVYADSVQAAGALSGTMVEVNKELQAGSLTAESVSANSLTLTSIGAESYVQGTVEISGDIDTAGYLQVGSLKADNVNAASLGLTGINGPSTVKGNLTANSVSLISGASLQVEGTLTASEIRMSGDINVLTAFKFGSISMNFEIDRAALESLEIVHGETALIASTIQDLPFGFSATLNGGKGYTAAAAYEYAITTRANKVQVVADYAYEGMQVWYRGSWVGEAEWNTDYFIAGFDAVDGEETVDLRGDDISGDYFIVALDSGVESSAVKNGTLTFSNVDLGGGELILDTNTTLSAQEIFGPGEKITIRATSALAATSLQLGTLDMTYGSATLKDASLGAITGSTGLLTIQKGGKVTVNSDVELGSFLNEGTLNLGSHNLTVNALTNQGGNVIAAEVSVQCRAGLMAEFDTLIADKVTVKNSIVGTRYTDDIVLGDGSIVGELLADKLVVKGGTVTLGSTTAETVQDVHSLELQNGATLILNQTYVNLGEDFVAEDGSVIQLVEGGGLRMGNLGVSSLEGAVNLDAAGLTEEIPNQLNGACLTAYGSESIRYDGELLHSGIVNESSATFSVTHAGNTLKEVLAQNGDIVLYNRAKHELQTLNVAAGRTLSAYSGGYADSSKEAAISVSGTATFGSGSQFNADLNMLNGSVLDLQGALSMGSSLTLGSGLTLSGNLLTQLQNAGDADVVTLFEGVDTLTILNKVYSSISHEDEFLASSVFSNLSSADGRAYYFVYSTAADGEGALGIYTTLKPELTLPWESGTYNVDGDVKIAATGGTINLRADAVVRGSIADTLITTTDGEYSARIEADITGKSSLTVNGGTLELVGHNTYTGGTTVNGGELHLATTDALGVGDAQLMGGSLYNDSGAASNVSVGTVRLNGAVLIGDYTTEGSKGWELVADTTVQGSLTLGDGALTLLDGSVLTVSDTLLIDDATLVLSDDYKSGETYTLMMAGTISGDVSDIMLECANTRLNYELSISGSSLLLNVTGNAASLTWGNVKKAVWTVNGTGWLEGGEYCDGDHVMFANGTVSIVGNVQPGEVRITPAKSLTFKTSYNKKTGLYSGAISGDTALYISAMTAKGKLTMNDGNTYSGGTFIEAGTVNAKGASSFGTGAITLSGGTLNLASKAVANDITLSGAAAIKSGKKYLGTYTQTGGELMKGSVLNVAESATISGGVVNGTLSGYGTVFVTGDAAVGKTGKVTTNGLDISGSLAVSSKGLSMNTKTSAITVNSGAELISEGALKAAALTVDGGVVGLHSAKASSIAITNHTQLNNGADVTAFANMKTANLTMTDSQLTLGGAQAQPQPIPRAFRPSVGGSSSAASTKPLSLTVKGNVELASSALTLSGKISTGNLTVTDSYVNMTSGKLQTIAVKNTLTLSGDNSFIFDFDAKDGKSYKLFTFKYFISDGTALHELLGWEANDSYTLTANAKNITLTVNNAEAWEAYMDTLAGGEAVETLIEDDELVESAGAQVLVAPADVDPRLGKVADTLVQSTWGTAGASRAFGDTIAARGTHATEFANGKAAAWISTMGGSSRISSDGAHAGADYTLTGAAFGMEARLSEKSTVGLAIGNSWGKVSTFSAFPVDADSTHQGIYGKHILGSSTTLSWMAAHTRTESDANLADMACDWTQDALQLDARVDKLFSISDRTTVSAFVGLQYLATDKGECNGMSTGSLQNLRGEIGVSAAHKATDRTYLYGELSFIGDMVRHNPTATVGDYRSRGANPGRAGLNLSVGGSYQLNDSWSLNASYNLELMQNQTSHSANVGATYSF